MRYTEIDREVKKKTSVMYDSIKLCLRGDNYTVSEDEARVLAGNILTQLLLLDVDTPLFNKSLSVMHDLGLPYAGFTPHKKESQ